MIYIVLNNSPKYGGGVEQVVKNLVSSFPDSEKDNLKLITNTKDESKKFEYEGLECVNLYSNKYTNPFSKILMLDVLLYSYRVYKYLKNNAVQGSVVNFQGIEYGFFTMLFGNSKIKTVVTSHGCLFEQVNEFLIKNNRNIAIRLFFYYWRWYYWLFEKLIISRADFIIYCSERVKRYIKKTYAPKSHSSIIYNPIILSHDCPRREIARGNLKGLIIGSSSVLKGLDIAIEAFSKINADCLKVELDIAGFSDFSYKDLPSGVNYIGRIKPQEMLKYYCRANFLLLPSRFEVFPMVVLESLSHGMPVICSKYCSLNEISKKPVGIVLDSLNPEKIEEAIKKMLDKSLYFEYKKNIEDLDLSKFSAPNVARLYLETFKSI